ncbi:hypothetical protein EZV62_016273 [Acer yangbiense]|uniref:RING-type domain-containing protein n=1 Tax=Acer yangbiense TaxID=1000413 RepID=A0A5C7HNP8_9ROSI|nr:hypothetical protein EZV62_016273 [Acer yangbiense]
MADPNPSHFNEELETANEPLIAEEDDNYEEEDDTEDDYDEEDDEEPRVSDEEEEEDDEDDEDDEEEFPLAVESPPRVPDSGPVSIGDGERRRVDEGEESCLLSGQWNRSEIDGLFCSICMDAWTNKGDHHISCLPCGHIYGLSCIKKWLQQCRSPGKCPQCNQKCSLTDVRKLFASRIVAVDEESQKRIRSLEAKCASFEKKGADWCKKEAEWQKIEVDLRCKFQNLEKRIVFLEFLFGDKLSMQSGSVAGAGDCQGPSVSGPIVGSKFSTEGSSCMSKIQCAEAMILDPGVASACNYERFDDIRNIFVAHKAELEKVRSQTQKILEKQEILNTEASEILTLVRRHFSSGSSNLS